MLSTLTPFLQKLSRSSSAVEAAVADNCRFDERAHQDRWAAFAAYLPTDEHTDLSYPDWSEAANRHYMKRVCVPSVSIPDALLEINRPAWLTGLTPNQTLIRLEALDRPLSSIWNRSFEELAKLHVNKDADAVQALARNFDDWNKLRDNRPAFAAFLDEIKEDAEHADWPHQLRDRLGLAHYSPRHGSTIPVALMRYSLQEVLNAQKSKRLPTGCALSSALDGGMHEFFFPVPREHPYGSTLHLAKGKADLLTAEIIHCRIDYQPKHLWKLGWISRPHEFSADDAAGEARQHVRLRQARDLHLTQLRIASERDDFGEEMVGRT